MRIQGLRIRIVPLNTELISAKVIDSLVIERLILKLEQVSAIQTRKLFPYLLGTRTKSIQTVTLIFFF